MPLGCEEASSSGRQTNSAGPGQSPAGGPPAGHRLFQREGEGLVTEDLPVETLERNLQDPTPPEMLELGGYGSSGSGSEDEAAEPPPPRGPAGALGPSGNGDGAGAAGRWGAEAGARAPRPGLEALEGLPEALRAPPEGECSAELQAKVARIIQLRETRGVDFLAELRKKRDIQNPAFLDKLIDLYGVDEWGTNLDPAELDLRLRPEDTHESLRRQLEEHTAALRRGKLEEHRSRIGFVAGAAVGPAPQAPAVAPATAPPPPAGPQQQSDVVAAAVKAAAAVAAKLAQQGK